jgi:hypothetical protein
VSAANVDEYLGASIKLTGFAAIRCASSLVSFVQQSESPSPRVEQEPGLPLCVQAGRPIRPDKTVSAEPYLTG